MNLNKEFLEQIKYFLKDGEEKSFKDNSSISLLEILKRERELYDLKIEYIKIVNQYMKKHLEFNKFYFRYNEKGTYDTIVNFEKKDNYSREVILRFDNSFEILNPDLLKQEEYISICNNIDFYEQLTKFGIEQNYMKQSLFTISRIFSVELLNDCISLYSPVYRNLLYISYSYNQAYQKKLKRENEDILFGNNNYYDTDEGIVELSTKIYKLRKLLTKNNCENIIELLDNLYVYEEELPLRLRNDYKKKQLIKLKESLR